MDKPKATLIYMDGKNSFTISLNGELASLTDMWIAAGRPAMKETWRFGDLPSTKAFVRELCRKLNLELSVVWPKAKRGSTGGTFVHRQIAIAYAKYLSPKFHIWANGHLMEHIREEQNPESVCKNSASGVLC